jgi:hypothetical protein
MPWARVLAGLSIVLVSFGCATGSGGRGGIRLTARVEQFEAIPEYVCRGETVTIRWASRALESTLTSDPPTATLPVTLPGIVPLRETPVPVTYTTVFQLQVRSWSTPVTTNKTVRVIQSGDDRITIWMDPCHPGQSEPHWQKLPRPGEYSNGLYVRTVQNLTGRPITLLYKNSRTSPPAEIPPRGDPPVLLDQGASTDLFMGQPLVGAEWYAGISSLLLVGEGCPSQAGRTGPGPTLRPLPTIEIQLTVDCHE